ALLAGRGIPDGLLHAGSSGAASARGSIDHDGAESGASQSIAPTSGGWIQATVPDASPRVRRIRVGPSARDRGSLCTHVSFPGAPGVVPRWISDHGEAPGAKAGLQARVS